MVYVILPRPVGEATPLSDNCRRQPVTDSGETLHGGRTCTPRAHARERRRRASCAVRGSAITCRSVQSATTSAMRSITPHPAAALGVTLSGDAARDRFARVATYCAATRAGPFRVKYCFQHLRCVRTWPHPTTPQWSVVISALKPDISLPKVGVVLGALCC